MIIVGFAGQMRMGKDVAADYLAKKLPIEQEVINVRTSFAGNVKKVYCDTFNVDKDFIEKWKTNPDPPPGFNMNVRKALQFIGDGFRQIKASIWMDLIFNQPVEYDEYDMRINKQVIISDVRYVNEMRRIKEENGMVVLLCRPGFENDDPNPSESEVRPIIDHFNSFNYYGKPFEGSTKDLFKDYSEADKFGLPLGTEYVDFFLRNDGTLEELYDKIDHLLVPYIVSRTITFFITA